MTFRVERPRTMKELLGAMKSARNRPFRLIAGGTDLLLELRRSPVEGLTLISLAGIADRRLCGIRHAASGTWIGARCTAAMLVDDERIAVEWPVLHQAASCLASTQIRQVATVGGNLGTASPSGDIACALMALDAECVLLSATGRERALPVHRFFTGPRATVLKAGELLLGVRVPVHKAGAARIHSGFIKVGTRRAMECAVVSLAHHLRIDARGTVVHAGVAFGACAPTIRVPADACAMLRGLPVAAIGDEVIARFAKAVVAHAAPITDLRAGAWYRAEVLRNVSMGMLEDLRP